MYQFHQYDVPRYARYNVLPLKMEPVVMTNCFVKVCDEVTEIQCDIVPYTECEMLMESTPYKSFKMVPKVFNKKICNETTEFIPHTKMMPECKNVTKQNCVTKWETDADGKQVSA